MSGRAKTTELRMLLEGRSSLCLAGVRGVFLRCLAYFALILVAFLTACHMPGPEGSLPQPDVQSVQTSSAQTVVARFTLSAGATAVSLLTQAAPSPTSTPLPVEPSPLPTDTPPEPPTEPPPPTPTPLPPTETPVPVLCDAAEFVTDVTTPPNSSFTAGAQFVKTWRVRNAGSCTWTARYALVFSGGNSMGSVTTFPMPKSVAPGQTVDVSATLTAPGSPGYYQSTWVLRNAARQTFGAGLGASVPLVVQIQVVMPINWNNFAYDFAANYCVATWQSETGGLSCPGSSNDPGGAAYLQSMPSLETGQANTYALLTHPNNRANGWISGYYPYYMVNTNDHFISEVGCLRGSAGCDLTFQLDYRTTGGAIRNLGGWREVYDGQTTPIDVDLSYLAGQRLQFILTVTNNGDPGSANAFWLTPSIQNISPSQTAVLTWTQEGGRSDRCDELRIYLTGRRTAEAHAYSCRQGEHELGRGNLSRDEVDSLLEWLRTFREFDSEVYRASPDKPLIAWISFQGQGNDEALDVDIQEINDFATNLYDSLVH